jgi:hypothetical protein
MSSDLYAVVAADQLDKPEAKRIAGESRLAGGLRMNAEHAGRRGPWLLEVPDVHLLLADGADLNALSWPLSTDGATLLGKTLEWLYDELPSEFTFEVLWGEAPIEKLVSRDELLRIVQSGHLGGRTRYRVMPA